MEAARCVVADQSRSLPCWPQLAHLDPERTLAIATRDLTGIDSSGQELSITLGIGAPHPIDGGDWACPLSLGGLYSVREDGIFRVDSFQALKLGVTISKTTSRVSPSKRAVTLSMVRQSNDGYLREEHTFMTARIAIVAYRCEVAGVASDSIDIQVRYFEDTSIDIAAFLRAEPIHSYSNNLDELVTWPFVAVLAVENFGSPKNGGEIAGFITGGMEFPRWTRKAIPA